MQKLTWWLVCSLLAAVAAPAQAQWGDLTATFQYDGAAPRPQPLTIDKDVQFCKPFMPVNESLMVNPKNKGVANVIVYVYVRRGSKPPRIHPDYAKDAEKTVTLDNKGCRFEPHVLTLRTSQTLIASNSDKVGHNTNITALFRNVGQNPLIPAGGETPMKFPNPETIPVKVSCNIHPWMNAMLVIKDHPYMAVSDKDGKLRIKNLPAQELTFQIYHERVGYVQKAAQNGKPVQWRAGRVKMTIKPGENDLGVIQLSPEIFKD